jgi:Tol biopolymer transport system component
MIGQTISHYKILERIGAGGMGVVYKAEDTALGRLVALKFLPPELTQDHDAKTRFMHEARAASALQHNNICTIHEIEQAEHGQLFICMDHYEGETLKERLKRGPLSVDEAIGLVIQVAHGLEEAHRRGILHRDIKPANVMITSHGVAKILDFGLARMPGQTQVTKTGSTVGTVAYMSPEQIQGGTIDPRSDLFSLGVAFYELLTGVTPFAADHEPAIMHKILNVAPPPLRLSGVKRAAEMELVIGKMLAKEPADRYRNARDVIDDLSRISRRTYAARPRRKGWRIAMVTAGVAVGALAMVLLWREWNQRRVDPVKTAFRPARVTTVMSRNDIMDAAISPDGRHIAYAQGDLGEVNLWIRQLATGTDIHVLGPRSPFAAALSFSPDGDYLFFITPEAERPNYLALYQVPSLGGAPRKRAFDVDSRISFAPDGRRICFLRGTLQGTDLVVLDMDTDQERVLATCQNPIRFDASSWSPDGARIVVAENRPQSAGLLAFRVEDGVREEIGPDTWYWIRSAIWLSNGEGILVSGWQNDPIAGDESHIWFLSTRSGRVRLITSDTHEYTPLSASWDAASLAAVRHTRVVNLWSTEIATRLSRQLTSTSTGGDGVGSYDVAEDGSIVFLTHDRKSFRKIEPGRSGDKTLLSGVTGFGSSWLRLSDGGIVFSDFSDNVGRPYVTNADGESARPLLPTAEGAFAIVLSPDGRTLLFRYRDRPEELWAIDVTGGAPVQVANGTSGPSSPERFSRSGDLILTTREGTAEGGVFFHWVVVPASGGEAIAELELSAYVGDVEWAPGGRMLTFVDMTDGVGNVFQVALDDTVRSAVTRFTDGTITDHEWSPDGTRLLLVRRTDHDNLWLTSADGRRPEQLTDFETGTIFGARWAPDGERIVFTYGQEGKDIVLIQDWREAEDGGSR